MKIHPLRLRGRRKYLVPSRHSRRRFSQAARYAAGAIHHGRAGAYYRALATVHESAFRIGLRDFFTPPTVDEIALGLFDGLAGDEIIITACDDTEVTSVDVFLRNRQGHAIESGPAENRLDDTWVFPLRRDVPFGEPLTIEVVARDRPGNVARRRVAWEPCGQPATWLPSNGQPAMTQQVAGGRAAQTLPRTIPRLIT